MKEISKKTITFLFLLLISFFISSSIDKNHLTFGKEAKAAMVCEWNGSSVRVCCFSNGAGCLVFDGMQMEGPYYYFPGEEQQE
jgi:hypothetical protein